MKTLFLVLGFIVSTLLSLGQNNQISFSASGESSIIDSVNVKNLSSCTEVLVMGSEILQLDGLVSINDIPSNSFDLNIYPNPNIETSYINFFNPEDSEINIELYDISGVLVAKKDLYLKSGSQLLAIENLSAGIYLINVSSGNSAETARIVSLGIGSGTTNIKNFGVSENQNKEIKPKSNKSIINMPYNQGDRLLFTAYSGIYSRVVTLVPTGSETINFEFISCTDGDGNHYPVVTIGNQTWMAQNLRTTTMSNGIPIPHKPDSNDWLNSEDAYCWVNNDISTADYYGAIYKWNSASAATLCPPGWRTPSDNDWAAMVTYLGGADVAGGKLKSVCSDLWIPPNGGATNEYGFSGLPAGYRKHGGDFSLFQLYGDWWSTTLADCGVNAWTRSTRYMDAFLGRYYFNKNAGFPVRCIKID